MIGIFVFSCMPGEESGNTSRGFLMAIAHIVEGITHRDFTTESVEAWHHVVRKGAHFTEYALLGDVNFDKKLKALFQQWIDIRKCGINPAEEETGQNGFHLPRVP